MFSHITVGTFHWELELSKLSEEKDDCLKTVSAWVEKKWGYIRKYPGLEKRMELVTSVANNIFILKHKKQLVGMFALFDYSLEDAKIKANELMYVYVDERYRGMGIFNRIVYYAKKLAKESHAELLVLDTLNTNLNKRYIDLGARIICESQFKVKNEKYDLCLMSDEIKPEPGKIYVKKSKKGLEYTVVDPTDTVVKGIITETKLPKLNDITPSLAGILPLLPDILAITSNRGHTEMLTYPTTFLSMDLKKFDATVVEYRWLKRRGSFS